MGSKLKLILFGTIMVALGVLFFLTNIYKVKPQKTSQQQINSAVSQPTITPLTKKVAINSSATYSREIQLGKQKLQLIMKTVSTTENGGYPYISGAIYQFFSSEKVPKLIKEVGSVTPPEFDTNGNDAHFLLKDVTGDGIPEILITMECSGNFVCWHEILTLDYDENLKNISISGEKNKWVSFDTINYKNGFIITTDHGANTNFISRYSLDNNWLTRLRTISFTSVPGSEGGCDIREWSVSNTSTHLIEQKKNCNIWVDDLEPYLDGKYIQNRNAIINYETAPEFGLSTRDYSLLHLDLSKQPHATLNGKEIYLISYLQDWSSSVYEGYTEVISKDLKTIWKGDALEGKRFTDIDKDGVPEINLFGDAGGNTYHCAEKFYKWDGKEFGNIKFIYNNVDLKDYKVWDSISCDEDGKLIPGTNPVYISYRWTHMYPDLYKKQRDLNVPMDEWDINARLCKKIEMRFYLNKSKTAFVQQSEKTVEENHDTYEDYTSRVCF